MLVRTCLIISIAIKEQQKKVIIYVVCGIRELKYFTGCVGIGKSPSLLNFYTRSVTFLFLLETNLDLTLSREFPKRPLSKIESAHRIRWGPSFVPGMTYLP